MKSFSSWDNSLIDIDLASVSSISFMTRDNIREMFQEVSLGDVPEEFYEDAVC
jgi:hypothetical protein